MTAISGDLAASEIIRLLELERHPEGGWFRETFRDHGVEPDQRRRRLFQTQGDPRRGGAPDGRGWSTAIYYLLEAGDVSAWHRVDAAELWHWYAGGPLVITLSPDGKTAEAQTLGPDLRAGQRPQVIVPAEHWQTAESLGAWTLMGCTVAPGFSFDGFEMAPPDWRPGAE